MRRVLILIILLVLIALGIFWWSQRAPVTTPQQPDGIDTETTIPVSVSTSTIQTEAAAYTVDANYPVFSIPALDAEIKRTIDAGIAELAAQPANPSPNDIKNEFASTFDSVYIGPDLISVRLILYNYTGGAHGLSVATGVTYDRASERFLTLADALGLADATLQQVSVAADEQLTRQYGSVQFPEGIAPAADNFAAFVVNENSVVFTLQQYQAMPYASGMPQVVVPRVR